MQEVESPAFGILSKIVSGEGAEVPCTTVIAVITNPGEPLPDEIPEMLPDSVRPKSEVEVLVPKMDRDAEGEMGRKRERIRISPVARKLARELDIDATSIVPSGSRITKADVEAAFEAQRVSTTPPSDASAEQGVPGAGEGVVSSSETGGGVKVVPLTGARRTIAERMALSARTVARAALTLEADAAALIAWREELRAGGYGVGYSPLLTKVVARALDEFPYMNRQLVDDEIREMADINIGIATDTERGLLVPVIRETNRKGVLEIHQTFLGLVERARAGRSTLADLTGGTFTITNLGMYGIEEILPIINLPECAILGIGAIVRKPVVVRDEITIGSRFSLTLSFDHRLVDGAPAARFLQHIKHLVESPVRLLD